VKPAAPHIDLVLLGPAAGCCRWSLGRLWPVAPAPEDVARHIEEQAGASAAAAWLFWDGTLGQPDEARVLKVFKKPGNLWHAGLLLGAAGRPAIIDFIQPTWMLNRDPDAGRECTSWRISLRACLVETEVLRQMGGVDPGMRSLETAALEMGLRYVQAGVITRYAPALLDAHPQEVQPGADSLEDQVRFACRRFGPKWAAWALLRMAANGLARYGEAMRAWRTRPAPQAAPTPAFCHPPFSPAAAGESRPRVSVLIPTVDRYPYLSRVLDQLRGQTTPAHEILVVDQTAPSRRPEGFYDQFQDLPLRVLLMDEAGQCSSRNRGLKEAAGDYILFLDDDDDELPAGLLERHLNTVARFQCQVSSGIVTEAGADGIPADFQRLRVSNVFPTNNSLIDKRVLHSSGLFDLAYNRGSRADGDLGMRIYMTGAAMILNPEISVYHHHAAMGGLRKHKARVVTYAASRQRLLVRHLKSVTEFYLAHRYFSPRQVREASVMAALGTLSIRGPLWKRLTKVVAGLSQMPSTLTALRRNEDAAKRMFGRFPNIPMLEEPNGD
jgi:hypothetical protein